MLAVYVKLVVKPEHIEKFISLTSKLVEDTRTEPGCLSFELTKVRNEECVFGLFERFTSYEALLEHMKMDYFLTLFPQIKELLECTPAGINHDLVY